MRQHHWTHARVGLLLAALLLTPSCGARDEAGGRDDAATLDAGLDGSPFFATDAGDAEPSTADAQQLDSHQLDVYQLDSQQSDTSPVDTTTADTAPQDTAGADAAGAADTADAVDAEVPAPDVTATDTTIADTTASDTTAPDAVAADASADVADSGSTTTPAFTWKIGGDTVTVTWTSLTPGRRRYVLSTTHPLRDNQPASKQVVVDELPAQSVLRSGHLGLDATYALALQEARENSVSALTDGAFNQGKPVACACYATGAKWPWAWTRDAAYAVALGLADLDPTRAAATLRFKTALPKASVITKGLQAAGLPSAGGGRQLVQDTGTGGSWPVSTDRVAWAVGAAALLDRLDGAARQSFAAEALAALRNTLETDRAAVWDATDGLYRGEMSFLDWREQSYPSWVKGDLVAIAEGKALSTNVLFWHAHKLLAQLATEAGDTALAASHNGYATKLRAAILQRFAVPGTPLLASWIGGPFHPAAEPRFELLGNVLAVRLGLIAGAKARALLSAWPTTQAGPPVLWPQQPGVAIYHNRAVWPFVTGWYGLAAGRAAHAAAAALSLRALTERAALNLSHMENFEFLSGKNYVADGALSGPVVNSRRQLWSVAGFVAAVHQLLFGLEVSAQGLRVRPMVPRGLRHAWLAKPPSGASGASKTPELRLTRWLWRGHQLTIRLRLPPPQGGVKPWQQAGHYVVKTMSLNGTSQPVGGWISPSTLSNASAGGKPLELTLTLAQPQSPNAPPPTVASVPLPSAGGAATGAWLAPVEPSLQPPKRVNGMLTLSWSPVPQADDYTVYRDGVVQATKVQGTSWQDSLPASDTGATATNTGPAAKSGLVAPCYTVVARAGALYSQPSAPQCWWGEGWARIQTISAFKLVGGDGVWSPAGGSSGAASPYLRDVGATGAALTAATVVPTHTGPHGLQLVFRNPHGPPQTGVTCATARVRVTRLSDGEELASGRVVLPQQGGAFAPSSVLPVNLSAKEPVRVDIDRGPGLGNMSQLAAFSAYTGGKGGGGSAFNLFDLQAIKLLSRSGPASDFVPSVQPDGNNDLNKLPKAAVLTPGYPLTSWARVGITWDERDLIISVVSKAFEQPFRPFMLYLQVLGATDGGKLPAAQTSQGVTYGGLTAKLPFTPSHLIAVRSHDDSQTAASKPGVGGPWRGVYRRTATKAGVSWALESRFEPGVDLWLAKDQHTLTVRVPRAQLGATGPLRLAGHVMWGAAGHEWKAVVPAVAMPWKNAATGYYELDLSKAPGVKSWLLK